MIFAIISGVSLVLNLVVFAVSRHCERRHLAALTESYATREKNDAAFLAQMNRNTEMMQAIARGVVFTPTRSNNTSKTFS